MKIMLMLFLKRPDQYVAVGAVVWFTLLQILIFTRVHQKYSVTLNCFDGSFGYFRIVIMKYNH